MIPRNIFENIPPELPTELVETLVEGTGFKMERIVSRGHASPEGFWYDQRNFSITGGKTLDMSLPLMAQ
ncbi:MAG: hypothetical protein U1F76_12830 [Candidatus Competibacteraceae bacterium]